jgi:hypothetical protein
MAAVSVLLLVTCSNLQFSCNSPSDHSISPRARITERIISARTPPTQSATVIRGQTEAVDVRLYLAQDETLTQVKGDGLARPLGGATSKDVASLKESNKL